MYFIKIHYRVVGLTHIRVEAVTADYNHLMVSGFMCVTTSFIIIFTAPLIASTGKRSTMVKSRVLLKRRNLILAILVRNYMYILYMHVYWYETMGDVHFHCVLFLILI